jgi:hypothetical protein
MKLSPKQENFLKHWMYEELHFRDKSLARPAKELQRQQPVVPAQIAAIIAAWMPDPIEQDKVLQGPPPETPPEWPWASREEFQDLLSKATQELEERNASRQTIGARR